MRRSLVALVPAAAGLLLAACVGDRDSTAPRIAPSDSPSLDRPTTTACDATIKTDARAFFSSYPGDPVFTDVDAMAAAYGTGGAAGAAAATPFGLNIFNHIANARQTSRQRAGILPAVGGKLAHDVAACTNLGALDATFAGTAIASGVFAVRGGAGDSVVAALAKPDVFPRWGVESETAGAWPTSLDFPRYLVYGVPGAPATELGGEPLAVSGFVGYDVATLAAGVPKDGLRVGICVKVTDADGNAVNRLIHGGVVEENSAPTFCTGAPVLGASLSTSAWFASVANRMTSVFTPALLHAQDGGGRDFDSFTGGGPSSWSPMAWGKIRRTSVGLSFTTQPKNGFNTTPLAPFVVHAGTPGHPLLGTLVTVAVFSNNGLPAGAEVVGTLTVTTDANGDAKFSNVRVKKAGGYTLTATATYGGMPTQTATSILFNVKNK